MEITKRTIPAMNAVEGFNPAEFTRQLPNDDGSMSLYLDVKYRLLWFRLHHPDGKIDSQIVHVDDKSAVVCCRLYADKKDADDQSPSALNSPGERYFWPPGMRQWKGAISSMTTPLAVMASTVMLM